MAKILDLELRNPNKPLVSLVLITFSYPKTHFPKPTVNLGSKPDNNVYRCHFRKEGGLIEKICTSMAQLEI